MAGQYFQTDEVILLGRTFDEYTRMFALNEATLQSSHILDAASGVSSFCAEANARGYHVTASDRIYTLSPDEIEHKCSRDLENMIAQLAGITQNYVWDYFPDLDALRANREQAYRAFVEDYRQQGDARYITADYPKSNFAGGQFDLALVSHFLFLYDEQLDYDFHRRTLLELLRIARQVRLFPLVNMRTERASVVPKLSADPAFSAYDIRIVPVDYEFIRNSREMMIIQNV
jgi:hypothetical protein